MFILSTFAYSGDDLHYVNENKTALSQLLSYKKMQLQENVFLSFDLSCVLALVDERFEADTPAYLLQTQNPDTVFLTLSYKF